jgi:hypothetical protein
MAIYRCGCCNIRYLEGTTSEMTLKTKATRDIQKISAIAVPFGNDTHVVTPRSFLHKRVWVLTQQEYDTIRQKRKEE